MKIVFKITRQLLSAIRVDLRRRHQFAAERVGFISAGFGATPGGILALAQSYQPVADGDYVPDATVGAMMGPGAIRSAMQWALTQRVGIFHVHSHEGIGLPWFSSIDLREQIKFMPSFQNVAAHCPHGALVQATQLRAGSCGLHEAARPCLSTNSSRWAHLYANGAVYEPARTSELSWSGKPGSTRPGDGRPRWAGRRRISRQSAMRTPWNRRLRAG